MPGKEARDGFWFQDAKALTRLLDDALERRRQRALGMPLGPELRVRVESPVPMLVDSGAEQPADAAPRATWDGTFIVGETVVVDECKLGGPSRDDRVTFYRRLRATVADGIGVGRLVPRMTVGKGALAESQRWHRIGGVAPATMPADAPPGRVDSVEKLVAEALYYLTVKDPIWKR